jgi:chemotaxis protein CheC
MLALPYPKALELADLLLDQPAGTTTQLGQMERSALAEVGNLTTAYFLNKVDALTGLGARPTPPAVMVDMIGAIIDIIISTTGGVSENVLMLHASLVRENREAQADFWLIPDPATIDLIAQKAG